MKVVEESEDDADLQVIDDEDLQLAAQIERERKERRAQKMKEKREKEGKPPKKEARKRGQPPTKKRRVDSSDEEDDEESPKKRKTRRRAKSSEDEESEDEAPRKTTKKTRKQAESSDDEEEERASKKTRKARRRAESSVDSDSEEERNVRKKKNNLKKKKVKKQVSESEESSEESEESSDDDRKKSKKKKKNRASKKRAETSESEESDVPKKKKKNQKKRKTSESESESEEEEERKVKKNKNKKVSKKQSESSESDVPKKKKKTSSKKRVKEESSDEESEDEEKEKKKKKPQKKATEKNASEKKKKAESSGEETESVKNDKKEEKEEEKKEEKSEKDEKMEEDKEDKKSTKRKLEKSPSEEQTEEKESAKSDSDDDIKISPKKQKEKKVEESESEEEVMPKQKRRGVVVVSDEEDSEDDKKRKSRSESEKSESEANESKSDGSDSDEKSKKKKKSKKDDKKKKKKGMIMDDSKLAKSTVDAEKAERERRKRLEKRQKEFNGIVLAEEQGLEEALAGEKKTWLKKVEIDPDSNSNPEDPVTVHPSIVRILKPHQADGVKFMYDCAFESIDRLEEEGSGGILAHCMGLGKTLQVITFLHTVMMHDKVGEKCRRVLIVVPKNVIINWFKEFQKWLEDNDPDLGTIEYDEMDRYKTGPERLYALKTWHKSTTPSVMIIGYDMFRILTCEDDPKKKKTSAAKKLAKLKVDFRKYLQSPGPDMVICDEAHKLKNDESALSKCMVKIETKRRICLTGTPLQNNLMEYHCMVNFVKPGLLGTKLEFANRFVNIINRGRTKDASPLEVSFMKRRCHVLYEHLKKCVDRKDYRVLTEAIPPKQEYVINVRMTDRQCSLYKLFLDDVVGTEGLSKRLLPDYHMFSRIWTHPYQLILHEQRLERERVLRDEEEEEAAFIDDEDSEEESGSYRSGSSESEDSFVQSGSDSDSGKKKKKKNAKKPVEKPKKTTRRNRGSDEEDDDTAMDILQNGIRQSRRLAGEDAFERDTDTPPEYTGWFAKSGLVTDDDRNDFTLSNKLVLLMQIIKKCEAIGDKLLVFSQSLESLALIKRMLEHLAGTGQWFNDQHEALNAEDEAWSWLEGTDYMTIDGSVQSVKRDSVQTEFNDPQNLRARLMLISTRAGSLGTNMVAANRVVIFDACWNPSHDTQSLFRVYRFGQTKPVYIYRFIAQGTMEERIYKRQVTKESTSMRVVDEAQIQRHYLGHDLTELYQFTPSKYDPEVNIACAPPKDLLLTEVIHENPQAVVDYLEHDTLFANQEQEKLTEQEMKEAWNDYEKDKSGAMPTRAPYQVDPNRGGIIVGPHLQSMLQNRYQETMRVDQIQSDPLYRELLRMRTKDTQTFMKIILLRNLLNQLLPFIPDEMRGGMSEFNTHFIRLVHESERRLETPQDLLKKALESFKTVVRMISGHASCQQALDRMRQMHPYLFD